MRETEPLPAELEDKVLLAQIACGEPAALAALYDRYGDLVYSFLMRILGDPLAAGDLLQATFVRIWEHAPGAQYDDIGIERRILELAHEIGIAEARRRRAHRDSGESDVDSTATQAPGALPTLRPANEPARWMGTRGRIREALHSLPQDQRRAVELCYLQGYTQEEIARLLGEPLTMVKGRLRTALACLCNALEPDAQPMEP